VGEPPGFREFVEAHSRSLLRTAWLLTGEWPGAEDLVQVALAKTWPKWSAITRQDAPEVYVRRVLVTTFLAGRRRRWTGEVALGTVPDQPGGDPMAQADLRESIRVAMRSLPPRQRAVIALRYFNDLTESQTAAALGCSVGTVKSHAAKAMAKLRVAPGLYELLTEGVGR
jgi:RNA polymerase sigma-70 factor (sigma-E family)